MFFLYANINGVGINLLVDTGAAVSLLHSSVWHGLSGVALETWTGPRLVSVDGSALQILGGAKVTLMVGAEAVSSRALEYNHSNHLGAHRLTSPAWPPVSC